MAVLPSTCSWASGSARPWTLNRLWLTHTPEALAAEALALGMPTTTAADVAEAVARIATAAERPGRILICGSLYLAGRVLAESG